MRGKAARRGVCHPSRGITPAYAGKSPLWGTGAKPLWDHPRVCGEKCLLLLALTSLMGSPPRMRGKEPTGQLVGQMIRITPACAGKRDDFGADVSLASGSPPRVRGKALMMPLPDALGGITPACAGKRATLWGHYIKAEDHPRVCGEKGNAGAATRTGPGSPPRVRGKGQLLRCMVVRFRITPACAGKSSG